MDIKGRLMQAVLWLALLMLAVAGFRGSVAGVAACAVAILAASAWLIFQDGQRQVDEALERTEGDEKR